MSFLQFARDQYVRVLETNETATMGSYTFATSTELDQVNLWINVEGTPGGSETLQVLVYGSAETDTPMFSSEVLELSSVILNEGESTQFSGVGDFIGYLPFAFNREQCCGGATYYFSLKASNYTRNADTYYLGYCFDNPEPLFTRAIVDETAAKAIVLGFE